VIKLRQALESDEWRDVLAGLPGYSVAEHVGEVLSLTKALPWWNFKEVKAGGHSEIS
jgi:putative molybdopterin biosynthesis protein